ncbi:uncharacterized protein FIESC28_03085 [Fusarium coffeatum]|uniref:Uncharacterized protein n=1 Tax=Fusarium coffeatum TaxID=231269 RepID=A0A366S6B9_9HYPO|nr:uncharacterized protein FIESC28_03085 [Fusarium coffeatum]RBR24185.1 hypothetical protein FIESC28_03085 [Fusarium coffeatum]
MAPNKRAGKQKRAHFADKKDEAPPSPFKRPPEALEPFIQSLDEKHVYVTHIDNKPAAFKRKIFLVPVGMNVVVILLFILRMWWIVPWYWQLIMTGLGHENETTWNTADSTWAEISLEIAKRAGTMSIDFILFIFVWPWPVEFVAGQARGNPCQWRWQVGFREEEVYVRRSREWDEALTDILEDDDSKKILLSYIDNATSPILQEQKTGYLLMNAYWDLDWARMVLAHRLVDKKELALDAFKGLVLVHHAAYGWMSYDVRVNGTSSEDERRRQVFAFRDALIKLGKENLFYRWVEIVQYEATQPGGFGPKEQEVAAKRIRELFENENINFDDLWKESVGSLPQ